MGCQGQPVYASCGVHDSDKREKTARGLGATENEPFSVKLDPRGGRAYRPARGATKRTQMPSQARDSMGNTWLDTSQQFCFFSVPCMFLA